MLYRIVKMTFKTEAIEHFKAIFNEAQKYIISFDGCLQVQALQDLNDKRIFFTYSLWLSESDLESYRKSERFSEIWSKTKILFEEKPEAYSLQLLDERRK